MISDTAEDYGIESPRWRALSREGAIAGQSISAGLQSLRKANYAATGLYSHAFFSLSIGLERTLKLILLMDHALDHQGQFPSSQVLKNQYGHNIAELFSVARKIDKKRFSEEEMYRFTPLGIEGAIIKFLSDFAISAILQSRLYNSERKRCTH